MSRRTGSSAGRSDRAPPTRTVAKRSRRLGAWVTIAPPLLALAIFANTWGHGYVLDDDIVLRRNQLVQRGAAGLPGIFAHGSLYGFNGLDYFYRPLSLAALALEVELFGNDPHIHHAVNVALFAACCALVYLLLGTLLERNPKGAEDADPRPRRVALVASLLFAAHPIHTEVVANIKGRDELLCLLFVLVMLRLVAGHIGSRNPLLLVASTLAFALALLSKESGLAAVALVPLTLWFAGVGELRAVAWRTAPFVLVAAAFLIVRHVIASDPLPPDRASDVLNNAFVGASPAAHIASSVAVLGRYLGLLLLPLTLSYDYSYHQIPRMGLGDWPFLVALLVHIALIVVAVLGVRSRHPVSYAILWYGVMIAGVSNLLVPLGTVMGERLIFAGSVGFCLAIGWLLVTLLSPRSEGSGRWVRIVLPVTVGIVLALYAIRSVVRDRDWKDEAHLYASGLRTAPNSARVWAHYGTYEVGVGSAQSSDDPERASHFREAVSSYQHALDILPAYPEALYNLGVAYQSLGATASARDAYQRALAADSGNEGAMTNLAGILVNEHRIEEARRLWRGLAERNPRNAEVCANLGVTYVREGVEQSRAGHEREANRAFVVAAGWFRRAHELSPGSTEYVRNLAMIEMRLGNEAEARRLAATIR